MEVVCPKCGGEMSLIEIKAYRDGRVVCKYRCIICGNIVEYEHKKGSYYALRGPR